MAEKKSFLLRLDPDLYDELRRWAEADLRSMNGQIEFILRTWTRERKSPKGGKMGSDTNS